MNLCGNLVFLAQISAFAMGAIKHVGEGACQKIIQERKVLGLYKGIVDFCERIDSKIVNKRTLESLIKAGSFDKCEKSLNRKSMVKNIEKLHSHGAKKQQEKRSGQSNFFDFGDEKDNTGVQLNLSSVEEYDEQSKLSYESALTGIYVSGHPLESFSQVIKKLSSMPLCDIHDLTGEDKREMTLTGIISSKKMILTKKGEKMCFAILEDLSSKIECVIFPKILQEYEEILASQGPFIIKGYVHMKESPKKFFPNKIRQLKDEAQERVTSVKIHVKMEQLDDDHLDHLKKDYLRP